MIAVRAGMGLGDSLYLQSVVRHLILQGHRVEACSKWPDVFRPLGDRVKVSPFRRDHIDRLAHYAQRKAQPTDQFRDCCIQAGILEPVELRLDWQRTGSLAGEVIAAAGGRPLVLVQLPRFPMDRRDGYGIELLPDCRVIQRAIDLIGRRAFTVQVGSGAPLYRFGGLDLDLAGGTTVADLLDLASAAAGFLGYVSYFVPLAESFSRPAMFVWSRRGLQSKTDYIRTITPQKILHRGSSRWVMDDCAEATLAEAVNAFCDEAGRCRPV